MIDYKERQICQVCCSMHDAWKSRSNMWDHCYCVL